MSAKRYADTLGAIHPLDTALEGAIRAHLDDLTKPPGSLGRLEDIAARFALIRGVVVPPIPTGCVCTFAGDHGVCAEGVSAFPAEVTPQMVLNMCAGGAAVNVLARQAGLETEVIDVGVNFDFDALADGAPENLVKAKVAMGTRNLRQEAAMTEAETIRAIEVGIAAAQRAADAGHGLICTGEMGIGNTTPAAALFAALLPCAPSAITGAGTGVDAAGIARKIAVIEDALKRHAAAIQTPLGALAAVGGLEIAAITGLILGTAARRLAVVIDGFISSAAALVAWRLAPVSRAFCFFSHRSAEQGHARFFKEIGEEPLLDLGLRLGEGTGAVLAAQLIRSAVAASADMATFSGAGVANRR